MKKTFRLLAVLILVILPALPSVEASPLSSTVIVETNIDETTTNGLCSLREAITAVNSGVYTGDCTLNGENPPVTMVIISVPTGTYTLLGSSGDDSNVSGDLDVLASMSIWGYGVNDTTVDANNIDRVFDIKTGSGANVEIRGMKLINGSVAGNGGGVFNVTNLLLDNVILDGNDALSGSGGGIYHAASAPGYKLTLTESVVSYNTASGHGGGIYNAPNSPIEITSSNITHNTAGFNGGGIFNTSTLAFRMYHSQVQSNSAPAGWGGGLYSIGIDDVRVEDSMFYDNDSLNMGGNIYHTGTGGLAEFYRCNISYGKSRSGGGLSAHGGSMTYFENTTFAYNTASGGADLGGAIYVSDATVDLSFDTISANTADMGGGIYIIDGTVTTGFSIIADNYTALHESSNCSGAVITSNGWNISNGTTCSLTNTAEGDLQGVYVGLGAYGVNNSRDPNLKTFSLLPGSFAIDAPEWDVMEMYDQRSFHRPVDGDGDGMAYCDRGAFELGRSTYLPLIIR